MENQENVLIQDKHILLCVDTELDSFLSNFCGVIITNKNLDLLEDLVKDLSRSIYICGNVELACKLTSQYLNFKYIIKELSTECVLDSNLEYKIIGLGQVPINIHNMGVYFKNYFNTGIDYFESINSEHQFQALTESNKPTNAYRTGLYITKVTSDKSTKSFHLLRCSSNLDGYQKQLYLVIK